MKIKIQNYTFNKSSKTVTFTDYTSISLDSMLLITNVTNNIIIYNFAVPSLGGSVDKNVLTLNYDTSSMSSADKLQIFYEDDEKQAVTDETVVLLRRIVKLLEPSGTVDRSNRQRVTLDAIQLSAASTTTELAGTLPVSGTVTITLPTAVDGTKALGYQAGLGFGQPVAGTTPYTTNTAALSWYQPVWEGPVDQRWRVSEDSHISYQLGIRNKLTWT